ncbi:MAG: glutathione binding-like protein [Thalassobaculaceae bacterium]
MKLYYKPGACSLASHVMLHEVGAEFDIEAVDTAAGRTETGRNFRDISPNGYVPALEIDGVAPLTESPSILQFIADTHSDKAFAPGLGSVERARLQQFLNFGSAELHKSWGPLFTDGSSETEEAAAKRNVASKFDYLESVLSDGRHYLIDNRFSAADAYVFVLSNWANFKDIDLTAWPHLSRYVERVQARPSTVAAMRAEGLL